MDFARWGGRRFLLCVATQVSMTALKWVDKIGDEAFGLVIVATVGAFIAGNVAQRKIENSGPG